MQIGRQCTSFESAERKECCDLRAKYVRWLWEIAVRHAKIFERGAQGTLATNVLFPPSDIRLLADLRA